MHEHRGLSLAIALAATAFHATLAFVLVVTLWIALSVYAIVKMIGSGSDEPSAVTVMVIVVLLVTLLVTGLAATVALLGRPMTPKKRGRGDAEQLAFEELSPPDGA